MKYIKNASVVEAITFEELVAHGKKSTQKHTHNMPWIFHYKGRPVTHENDQCYLIPSFNGHLRMTPADMLVTDDKGEMHLCERAIFHGTHERFDRPPFVVDKPEVMVKPWSGAPDASGKFT